MANLTWQDILIRLLKMTNDDLAQPATINVIGVCATDQFYGVFVFGTSKDGDVADGILDHGQHYLVMER